MPKEPITPKAVAFPPSPTIPATPGTFADGWVYVSGFVAENEKGVVVALNDVEGQTTQTIENIKALLAEKGGTLDDILKCNVFLADIRDFDGMNAAFARFFPNNPPARTTVEARLADTRWLVEINAVAFVGRQG